MSAYPAISILVAVPRPTTGVTFLAPISVAAVSTIMQAPIPISGG